MRGRFSLAAAAWSVLAGLAGSPAGADELTATFGSPLAETLHTVDIEIQDGVAVYTVRRALHNDGDRAEELTLAVDLPPEGIPTGMRLKSRGSWFDGKLVSAEAASERYWEIRAQGENKPRAVALLERPVLGADGDAKLHVFPLAGGQTVTVEYTVTAPVRARNGRVWLPVPNWRGEGLIRPNVRFEGVSDVRQVQSDEVPDFDLDDSVDDDGATWYSAVVGEHAPPLAEVRARYATVGLAGGRSIWRLELDAPVEWGKAPVGARVVFVLDASASEGKNGIDAQLDLVRGYLAQTPDAQAEIVLFRRRAARLFGEFVPAAEIGAALDEVVATAFTPGNGSSVEEGLAAAAAALAGWEGPARIIVMSDEQFRFSYDGEAAGRAAVAAAPADTVIHAVVRSSGFGGALAEVWSPDAALSPIARAGGGTVLTIEGASQDIVELARVTRPLVLPVRLDGFTVRAEGAPTEPDEDGVLPGQFADAEGASWPAALDEGVCVQRMQLAAADAPPPAKLVLRGWVWGKEWTREVPTSAQLSAKLPALALGHPLEELLEESEGRPLALSAGAVSRWTSYLAEEKGAGPAGEEEEGGEYWTRGSSGGCSISCGTSCGFGCGVAEDMSRYVAILRARIEPRVAECARLAGRRELSVKLAVETTGREIVDAGVSGADLPPPLRACVEDAVWAAQLDARFRWHRTFDVDVVIGDGNDAPAEPMDREAVFL